MPTFDTRYGIGDQVTVVDGNKPGCVTAIMVCGPQRLEYLVDGVGDRPFYGAWFTADELAPVVVAGAETVP